MSTKDKTELRVEAPLQDMAVLDGYCSGRGLDRTTVIRQILREWSERELHAATVIVRVAGRKPTGPESGRGE